MSGKATSTLMVEAKADTGDATRGLSRLQAGVITLNQATELLGKLMRGATTLIRETTGAALEQERVYSRLESSLASAGIAYGEQQDRIAGFLAEQQRLTRFGDDQTASVMANLANLTGALSPSIDELERMTRLAQDISQRTGRDLAQAAQAVGRAFAGNVEPLAEVLPAYRDVLREINTLPDAATRGAQGMALLSAEFSGAAQDIAPLDLALARLSNGWGDIREAIGDYIVQSPQVAALTTAAADAVDMLASALTGGGDAAAGMRGAIGEMVIFAGRAILTLASQVVTTVNTIRGTVREALDALPGSQASRDASRQRALSSASQTLYGADQASRSEVSSALSTAVEVGTLTQEAADTLQRAINDPRFIEQRERALGDIVDVARALERAELEAGMRRGAELDRINSIDAAFSAAAENIDEIERRLRNYDPSAGGAGIGSGGSGSGGSGITATAGASAATDIASGAFAAAMAGVNFGLDEAIGKADQLAVALKVAGNAAEDALKKEPLDALNVGLDQSLERVWAIKDAWQSLDMTIKETVTGSIAGVVESLASATGTAIANNDKLGKSLAKSSLQSLGMLASNVGSLMILVGTGASALPMIFGLGGPAAVGAGIGLVALGAGLGAAAGAIKTGRGGNGSRASDSGVGASLQRGIGSERQTTTVFDFGGATIVSNDPRTYRMLANGVLGAEQLGGVGDPLLVGA